MGSSKFRVIRETRLKLADPTHEEKNYWLFSGARYSATLGKLLLKFWSNAANFDKLIKKRFTIFHFWDLILPQGGSQEVKSGHICVPVNMPEIQLCHREMGPNAMLWTANSHFFGVSPTTRLKNEVIYEYRYVWLKIQLCHIIERRDQMHVRVIQRRFKIFHFWVLIPPHDFLWWTHIF